MTYHPSKEYGNMRDYWPQSGENLSDYISNKKRTTAVSTLEKCITDHPELTISLLDKLKSG